jgi:DNA polymerase-3 subunit delta'
MLPWHQSEFERLLASKALLPHAILLRGQQGIGKMAFARSLAQALLCETPSPSRIACGHCEACHWFAAGSHPDFRQVEPESLPDSGAEEQGSDKKASQQIGVDKIRQLHDFINISSHRNGPKIILVHPAEALNINAANALLKNLEEPPPRTHFLLVSHRSHALLPTIKSRCRQLPLAAPEQRLALEWLKSQNITAPELALAQTGNSPLLAVQLAAQDYWQDRDVFLRHIASPRFDPLGVAEQIKDYPVQHVVSWLQKWSYDLAASKFLGIIRYNPDRETALVAMAKQTDGLQILRFHREMVKLQRSVNHPLNARLFIEQLMITYADLLQPAPRTE